MMQGTKGAVAVRVCAYRKTDEQRRESERKLKKDAQRRQKQLQPETLEAAGYVVIVTTLDGLDAEGVLARLRKKDISQSLRESPRKKRRYQQDELWSGKFG